MSRLRRTVWALRARQLAKKLVHGGVDEARVIPGWAPGSGCLFIIEAPTAHGGVSLQVPRDELLPEEWFTISVPVSARRSESTVANVAATNNAPQKPAKVTTYR